MRAIVSLSIVLLLGVSSLLAQSSPACPCCSEDHRAFDFWVGEWNIYDISGSTLLGTSKITLQDGACIVQEEYTSAQANYSGRSLSSFDRNSAKWRQYWLDSQGNILQIAGEWEDGKMILKNTTAAFDTLPETINQLSWTPLEDGRVNQHWKSSTDGGTTWTVLFDGFYVKKEE